MSIGPLIHLASGYVQSLFSNPASGSSSTTQGSSQLSPFAQILSNLQQLQQSNPIQYTTVTQQISGNLQTAAQAATANGNTAVANQLTKLSTDFSNASTSSQLPSVQDLAQLIGGGQHRGQSAGGSSSTSATTSTSNLNEFLQSLNSPQNGNSSISALGIIDNTLSSAGL
jgi:hypothetical protein